MTNPVRTVSLEDLREVIERIGRKLSGLVKEAYVVGSLVEGCAIPGESDVDIVIVPLEKVDYFSLLDEEIRNLLDAGLPPDIIIVNESSELLSEARRRRIKIA
ncbi:MAG: nucleotidyltransferase domain-containing protein [Candidatus Korarchaeota archaeon]|nr:nucleotidyltransferase domain-containing protein [Candidatus Korarchaeota archaeon]